MAVRSENIRPVRSRKSVSNKKRRKKNLSTRVWIEEQDYFDYNLLAVVILLTCFGLVMLYSTSAYEALLQEKNDMFYFKKQALISAAAFIGVLIGSMVDYHFLASLSLPIYGFSLFLLFITRFIGREINGARRWIYIGPISFQPAELAKLAIILFLPFVIVKIGYKFKKWKAPMMVMAIGLTSALFTFVFTENLSTAVIIAAITFGLVFIAHPLTKPFIFIILGGLGLLCVFLLILMNMVQSSGSFRINRILVWLDPEQYASVGGYQIMQGLYAIGSGGFFGKGLGNSSQKLGALPEAQNDMIFSIICEELGVFGAILVIMMFVFMLYRLFFIAQNAPDLLGSLIATGIFIHIAVQVVLNIMVVTNMIPTTGITLPFISYGGTSILFLMAEMALALGISRQIRFNP